jgi:predicted outer membrane repeat protein
MKITGKIPSLINYCHYYCQRFVLFVISIMSKTTMKSLLTLILVIEQLNCTVASLLSKATGCVTTFTSLQDAVNNVSINTASTLAVINICTPRILIVDDHGYGLNMTGKRIFFNCTLPVAKDKCTLDGQSKTRIMTGSSARVKIERIRLINGYSSDGGAMSFGTSSKIVVGKGCHFLNNTASNSGGAIDITGNSTLDIVGSGVLTSTTAVVFQGNTANLGGSINMDAYASLTANRVSFTANEADVSFRYVYFKFTG